MENIGQRLTNFLAQSVPLASNLGLELTHFDGENLHLTAPLAPNINDKMTAFGGSLYCVAVMSCWGMVYLQTELAELNCNLVVSHAEIDYLRPVGSESFTAICHADKQHFEQFITDFKSKGKAKITLTSTITVDGKVAVSFTGQYAILPPISA
ncbi:hypothetical protein SIN8267_00332 [Sinobacterium norvegicum]|uniref:Thioesterase putative domain-containing protein n=1 Tax=Sinobacterium norvegicum TaxID=1641715 RepID=A0ABN8EGD5_9GAMM|nr:YiiD C-terminal domain-containing protein [Sinobacterium norvegicum]CAH0990240.1 hypothetical protein SIN8267_00332 [Sinobacterium norvegicum]